MDFFVICGVPLQLKGDSSPARLAIEEFFRLCLSKPDEKAIRLSVQELPDEKSLLAYVPVWLAELLPHWHDDKEVSLVYGETKERAALVVNQKAVYVAWLSATSDRLCYCALKKTREKTPLSVSSLLVPLLREIFADRGVALIHAAALQTPQGKGVLLCAESGGGKTTTSLSLIRNGARLLADDLSFLSTHKGRVQLHGLPEGLNLTQETLDFFPEVGVALANTGVSANISSKKFTLAASQIYGDACMQASCPLDAICFVRVDPEGPSLEPMPIHLAFGKLLNSHTFASKQRPVQKTVAVLGQALQEVPVYVLNTGHKPDKLGPWLMAQLAALP